MKKIWILIILLFISVHLFGQRVNSLNDMIVSSLNFNLEFSNQFARERPLLNIDTTALRYVRKEGLPKDFPFDSLQNFVFFHLNDIKRRQLREGIETWSVFYTLNSNNQMQISVVPFFIDRHWHIRTGRHIRLARSDGSNYFYEYCCEKQNWKLVKIQHGRRFYEYCLEKQKWVVVDFPTNSTQKEQRE